MKTKLITDYRDYYDHHFDREGIPFQRLASSNFSRPQMLWILQRELGLTVPRHGTGKLTIISPEDLGSVWVVHRNLHGHRGEGKLLASGYAVWDLYPDEFVVRYVSADSHSFRYLQVGNRAFWLSYQSRNDWRSNVGDVQVLCHGEISVAYPATRWPLFAIDFVADSDGGDFCAIDLNTAPGLMGTGVEKLLSPTAVVQLIKEAIQRQAVPDLN